MTTELAPLPKVVLGSLSFGVFWMLAVFPSVPFLPIGRTAGALLGAVLMIVFHVISPDDAYASIDLPILGLLFATMVVGGYLKGAGMFGHLGALLAWRSRGGRDLLCRVCVVTALASALFTNDTCCVVLTEFVLELAAERNLPAKPFLLALATSANIGSSATPIGNPQNLVIAFNSRITFLRFLFGILPAMLAGMAVNTVMLLCMYWKELEGASPDEVAAGKEMEAVEEGRSPASSVLSLKCGASPALRHRQNGNGNGNAGHDDADSVMSENISTKHRWFMQCSEQRRKLFLKSFAYVVTVGMLVAYMLGLNMSWTAITTAIALVVVDFRDAEPCLDKVLLICPIHPAGQLEECTGERHAVGMHGHGTSHVVISAAGVLLAAGLLLGYVRDGERVQQDGAPGGHLELHGSLRQDQPRQRRHRALPHHPAPLQPRLQRANW